MQGNTQGSRYPETSLSPCEADFEKCTPTCADTTSSCACRTAESVPQSVSQYRPRIDKRDARRVRKQVESAAAQLRLRGARKYVLEAVLVLLCDKFRITDDRMKLRHIMWEIHTQIGYRYDLKTLGRALASLADDNLLTYKPACGRGNNAVVALHSQFTEGIEILPRDARGKVILRPRKSESVTFSRRAYSPIEISKNLNTAAAPATASEPTQSRPTEVRVNSNELNAVMDSLPPTLAGLPRHLRWLLRGEVRRQLARGYLPHQIVAVLTAPMPENVARPYRLAMYRFAKNSIGAGLRLTRAQQAWDRRQTAAEAAAYDDVANKWLDEVTAATTPELRADLINAFLTCNKRAVLVHRNATLVAAARRACREHPTLALAAALRQWVADVLGSPTPATGGSAAVATTLLDDVLHVAHDGTCVHCRTTPGTVRPELPLPTPVCDQCWTAFAEPDLLEESAA